MREGLNLEGAVLETLEEIEKAIGLLESEMHNERTLVTLSERGVVISDKGSFLGNRLTYAPLPMFLALEIRLLQ